MFIEEGEVAYTYINGKKGASGKMRNRSSFKKQRNRL